ncbi:unnamed protein product [Caenorhabditis angaria]|uniref:C-type lectin domain-containing protein n=1 Tax=Caenorhabditis angaria TaxID=860376 RepID=A0A9P1IA99_9PELO|nr:unnamed protein product [Caenorhabditis angaria]
MKQLYFLIFTLSSFIWCSCPDGWTSYKTVCILPRNDQVTWSTAQAICPNEHNQGYMVNEEDAEKHEFVSQLARDNFPIASNYHIGLSYARNSWYWQRPAGQQAIQVNSTFWNPFYPIVSSTLTAVWNSMEGNTTEYGWQNIDKTKSKAYYFCEIVDTKNIF